jgi:NAD(P)-dependent dehydrogenase (short-subunit alcohol dehydrogenase family)
VFEVNFFGVVALTRAAMPLLRGGDGRIVHIGSVGGRIASPGLGPYSASKFAIEALAETQRLELARAGERIKVSLVEPGAVKTAIWAKAESTVDQLERAIEGDECDRPGRRGGQDGATDQQRRQRGFGSRASGEVERAPACEE